MTPLELQPCHLARDQRTLVSSPWPSALTDSDLELPSRGCDGSPTCSATWPPSAIGPTTPTTASATDLGPSRLVHLHTEPARPPRHAELTRPLPDAIAERLPGPLWTHQVEGHRAGPRRPLGGRRVGHLVGEVALLPGADRRGGQPPDPARAPRSPLFPTKALAHDQLRALTALELPGVVAGAYDGDASPEERTWIRKHASVVLTNPEMLHSGLLPHHERWATFLGRLRFIVLDELHAFRGIFGSHVAQLARRLRRLAVHHGADPVFICSSATIGAPQRLATALCGADVVPVLDDGSPSGPRTVALWQPPLLDAHTGARGSAHREAAALIAGLIDSGRTTLGFAAAAAAWRSSPPTFAAGCPRSLGERVRAYRGGYLAEERRAIEDELFAGQLTGVVATSALELGIDVGGLDAVVIDGFPGTIASFRQQAGRAGRSGDASAAVLVAGSDQLDQWLAAHPTELLTRAPEPAVVNPANPFVLDPHLRCAAARAPAHPRRRALVAGAARRRRAAPRAGRRAGGAAPRPAPRADRGVDGHRLAQPRRGAPQRGRRAGAHRHRAKASDPSATSTAPGARAGARGRVLPPPGPALAGGRRSTSTWASRDVEPDDGTTYTVPRRDTEVRLLDAERGSSRWAPRACSSARVEVHASVVGYQRKDTVTGAVIDSGAARPSPLHADDAGGVVRGRPGPS